MPKIEEEVWKSIEPEVNNLGLEIYDIEYLKEGTTWYLRVYIDKSEGVSIEDCENVSRAIDPLLDNLNPIKTAYSLEVSSPGIERVLKRPEHFKRFLNSKIRISFFKPVNGEKSLECILKDANEDTVTVDYKDEEMKLDKKDISLIKTVYDF